MLREVTNAKTHHLLKKLIEKKLPTNNFLRSKPYLYGKKRFTIGKKQDTMVAILQ